MHDDLDTQTLPKDCPKLSLQRSGFLSKCEEALACTYELADIRELRLQAHLANVFPLADLRLKIQADNIQRWELGWETLRKSWVPSTEKVMRVGA
jgi:hypothetical protein